MKKAYTDGVSLTGRRTMSTAIKLREVAYPALFAATAWGQHNILAKTKNLRTKNLRAREFALGIEALKRFVLCEPLRLVHECAFDILALESKPVDQRL